MISSVGPHILISTRNTDHRENRKNPDIFPENPAHGFVHERVLEAVPDAAHGKFDPWRSADGLGRVSARILTLLATTLHVFHVTKH